jgi:tRNA threonylcarbamoyl adenosine modification protein (Sua5/YciO/YrdC/YwlC family)
MRIITKEEFDINKEYLLKQIKNGAIFIHPTDTIYGIGCNALDSKAVSKVRKIKKRPKTPFSVIAPSKKWIKENCNNKSYYFNKWISKLPGPYTMILKLKNKEVISKEVNSGLNTLGVRIPNHWFSKVAKELNIPIITTSANVVGGDFMTSLEDLSQEIKSKVDFIIYEDEKKARPSKIIDLTKEKTKIIKR